jgi:hypothetical protein
MNQSVDAFRSQSLSRFHACRVLLAATAGLVVSACGADPTSTSDSDQLSGANESVGEVSFAVQNITIDIRRSLVVTEQPILDRFSFERVLSQLAGQSGVPGLTALGLFQQWWGTQNPASAGGPGPHCDDEVHPSYGTVHNGYPYFCRPAPSEGGQSTCDPFAAGSSCAYIPIGLFNRFDLAPEDGSHCGEHRIVFAKTSGITTTNDRNLLIFEATLRNPQPQQGLKGCRPIVDFWADLSDVSELDARADALEEFYFEGSGNIPPVISISHFGDNPLGAGQVRTNQFIQTSTGWSLREFKLLRECTTTPNGGGNGAGGGNGSGSNGGTTTCTALRFLPETVKNNAFGGLFEPASTYALAADFRAYLPGQVASLAGSSLTAIDIGVPNDFNTAQSQASGATADEMRYKDRIGAAPSALRASIQAELTALGSTLTVDDIALRAQAMSCAGCHRLNNDVAIGGDLTWPSALGFVHVSERETETLDGVTRYRLSPALIDHFLPHRKQIIEDFLNEKPRPSKGPQHPIGGRRSHG